MVGVSMSLEHEADGQLIFGGGGEDAVGGRVSITPLAGSKPSTGSITAAARVSGSDTR